MSSDHSNDPDVMGEYEEEDRMQQNPRGRGKWISGLVALIGAWFVVAPFVYDATWPAEFAILEAHFWSVVITGLALLVLGGYNYFRRQNERLGSAGVATFVALLGLWLIATPFVFGGDVGVEIAGGDLMGWTDTLLGLVVFLLGAYSALAARRTARARPAET